MKAGNVAATFLTLMNHLPQITKPLLERQRRARINRCLDELKELMSAALASEGENLTKLEKADVLELTVRHLHQLHREGELTVAAAATGLFGGPLHSQRPTYPGAATPAMERRRYQGGFMACAQQVIWHLQSFHPVIQFDYYLLHYFLKKTIFFHRWIILCNVFDFWFFKMWFFLLMIYFIIFEMINYNFR